MVRYNLRDFLLFREGFKNPLLPLELIHHERVVFIYDNGKRDRKFTWI